VLCWAIPIKALYLPLFPTTFCLRQEHWYLARFCWRNFHIRTWLLIWEEN
jgi:hypothetical protein